MIAALKKYWKWYFIALLAVGVAGLYIYDPLRGTDIQVVSADAAHLSENQILGLPHITDENRAGILERLEAAESKGIAEGKPVDALLAKQLAFVRKSGSK